MSVENGRRGLTLPITWSVLVSGAVALIAWGAQSTRVETLERADAEIKADVRAHSETLTRHGQAIAVTDARYAEILRRLEELDRKIERAR